MAVYCQVNVKFVSPKKKKKRKEKKQISHHLSIRYTENIEIVIIVNIFLLVFRRIISKIHRNFSVLHFFNLFKSGGKIMITLTFCLDGRVKSGGF